MRLSIFLAVTALVAPEAMGSPRAMRMITRDADGRRPIVVTLDSPVDARAPADVENGAALPTGEGVEMHLVGQLPAPSKEVLATRAGFDLDHDGAREFILTEDTASSSSSIFQFYESRDDDVFDLVHVLEVSGPGDLASFYPGDAGDADGDGRAEVTVFGRFNFGFWNRLYESSSPGSYPSHLVWQIPDGWWTVGARIADTDGDGVREIVIAGQTYNDVERIAVYENTGDNAYGLIYHQNFPELSGASQSMMVAHDLDGDGRDEILFGGIGSGASKVYMVESTGNNAYVSIWETELDSGGQLINVEQIVDAGDLDGDGRREFLAGGLRTGPPWFAIARLFEATGDNTFEPVADFVQGPIGINNYTSMAVADVDGDGQREIVLGRTVVKIYRNDGDNAWDEIWSNAADISSIGTGDHDGDGKDEVIFQTGDLTGVWEISPSDQADLDGDDVVDAIDNCVYASNPEQGPAVLGQTVLASAPDTFSWSAPAAVAYVRGPLGAVGRYGYDVFETQPPSQAIVDSTPPGTGDGFYYLVKPDCTVGSWQSSLGAEPGRDVVLP